jgi:uncharacterized protein (TIGR04222 family)
MLDMLIAIPGPTFFLGWGLLVISGIILGRFWLHLDRSTHYPMPAMNQLNAFEIAALQRGNLGLIEIALFNLWHRQMLETSGQGRNTALIKQQPSSPQHFENEVEKVVYDFANTERKPNEFLTNTHLHSQLKLATKPIHKHLERLHLKHTETRQKRTVLIIGIIFLILYSVGLIKIFLVTGDVFELVLIIPFLLVALAIIFGRTISYTKLGSHYQEKLYQHFKWLKSETNSNNVEPALVVALFGISALANFEEFAPFTKTFQSADNESNSLSSGGADGGGGD